MNLVTFGCSWTYGVGASWDPSHTQIEKEFRQYCMDECINYPYSFRAILSKKFNLNNINFSAGMSSNQRNFRLAREFLKKFNKNDVVMWGITSTARNEYFDPKTQTYKKIKFGDNRNYKGRPLDHRKEQDFFLKQYDHNNEIKILAEQMLLWNDLFNYYNIKNIWYDTFNTHNYPNKIENMIEGDLLSLMLKYQNIIIPKQRFYHMSSWINDDPRITAGVKAGLLNPISFHPTKKGHEILAEILTPYIEEKL